jgi:hypothetical protein
MAITELKLTEYVRSLRLEDNPELYDTFNRILLLSNSVFVSIAEKLVDPASGIVLSDFSYVLPLDDASARSKLEELMTGVSGLAQAKREAMAFMEAGGIKEMLARYISGVGASDEALPGSFGRYLAHSQQRGDRYVVYRSVDETRADSSSFWSYDDIVSGFLEVVSEDSIIASVRTASAGNQYIGESYFRQKDVVDASFVVPHYIIETLGVPCIFRSKEFLPQLMSGVFRFGSVTAWNSAVSELTTRAATEMLASSGAKTIEQCLTEAIFGNDGFFSDEALLKASESLLHKHIQTVAATEWIVDGWTYAWDSEEVRTFNDSGIVIIPKEVKLKTFNEGGIDVQKTVVVLREPGVGKAYFYKRSVDFFGSLWRAQVLRYYVPSLACFMKSPEQLDALEAERARIESSREDLEQLFSLIGTLSERLELLLVPQNS